VDECVARISSLGEGVGELPSLARTDAGDPVEFGGYLGPGYGQPSPEGEAEVRLVARTEGVFLLTGGTPTFFSRGRASL
jgi:D-cysteine desulfhydrase